MCGINGIYSFRENKIDEQVISKMNIALIHRGPDAGGVYSNGKILLGNRRLSIINLNANSNQPFISNDKRYSLVFNGEIYNYKEIKSQVDDYEFRTNSDTEVVLAAFIKWGKDSVKKLNGMFAFAIWDSQKEMLFIVRDRLGIKPLYYHKTDDYFIFSSEIRALLASDLIERKLNRLYLSEYFRYQTVFAPNTLVKNVFMLMPGEYIEIGKEGYSKSSYWKPEDINFQGEYNSEKKVQQKIKELLFKSVERRTFDDVPHGVFLSGGIDSSSIVAAMSEVSTNSTNTFSISFDEKEFSEEKYAKIVADKFKTNHHNIRLKANEFLTDIPQALNAMDHPSGDGLNTYTVAKATKEAGITVALSGLGGDEVFSGYPIFRQMDDIRKKTWIMNVPRGIRSLVGDMYCVINPGAKSEKINSLLKCRSIDFENAYPLGRQLYMESKLEKLLFSPLAANNLYNFIIEKFHKNGLSKNFPLQSKVSIMEFCSYMQNVLIRDADQMSMAHSLEVRIPYLDHELVEFALQIPDHIKLKGFPKQMVVESLGDLIPKELYQRKKMGFVFPWREWLKNEMKDFVNQKIEFLIDSGVVNKSYTLSAWKDFLNGKPQVNWVMIWTMVSLSNWMEVNRIKG